MTLHLIDDKTAPRTQRFRWQLKSRNGKIVAASSEGFLTARDCATNAWKTFNGIMINTGYMTVYFEGRDAVVVRQ